MLYYIRGSPPRSRGTSGRHAGILIIIVVISSSSSSSSNIIMMIIIIIILITVIIIILTILLIIIMIIMGNFVSQETCMFLRSLGGSFAKTCGD